MDIRQDQQLDRLMSEQSSVKLMPMQQVLRVRARGELYAIDLGYVECVLPLMELHYVPGGAAYLVGLMDYRGKSLPTIDLGQWLGYDVAENYNLDTPVIVCGDGQAQVAFIVNEAMQVESVKVEAIQMQDSFKESSSPFKASLNLSSGLVLLLDMQRILSANFTSEASYIPVVRHSL